MGRRKRTSDMSCIYVDRQYDKCMECAKKEFVELLSTLKVVFVGVVQARTKSLRCT